MFAQELKKAVAIPERARATAGFSRKAVAARGRDGEREPTHCAGGTHEIWETFCPGIKLLTVVSACFRRLYLREEGRAGGQS